MQVTFNSEKNGIEIRFDGKPEQQIIDTLKLHGFRWSAKQKMWYAKNTTDRKQMVESIYNGADYSGNTNNTEEVEKRYSLWEMTRTNEIGCNVDKSLGCKAIAAICRKHLRARFPMCKISVTSPNNSVDITIVSSPFAKDSEELNAIDHYCREYSESFKYCVVDDPYGDYGSTYNFFGGRNYRTVDYSYVQTEMTDECAALCKEFAERKAAFDKEEEARQAREFEEYMQEEARKKAEYEKAQKKHDEEHEIIVNSVVVNEANYFILGLKEAFGNKNSSIKEYEDQCAEEDGWRLTNCQVSRELHMPKDIYELFANHLLDDFDFIDGTGGSRTDDLRVQSDIDYSNMSEDERDSVEWYSYDTIAVLCDDELKFVIDAQGFAYARYVFLPCDDTEWVDHYESKQTITQEQFDECIPMAGCIEDASSEIIIEHGLKGVWNNDGYDVYKSLLNDWMRHSGFILTRDVIRAVSLPELKEVLYRVLNDSYSIKEQFENAGFTIGQKLTMIRMHGFGGMDIRQIQFKDFRVGNYAQYENVVALTFRGQNRRKDESIWLTSNVVIYDGWLNVPEELLWETFVSSTGLVCKKTRFLSCDTKQYDTIIEHFAANENRKPIINTYKPEFRDQR